jgi:hypothetical protein
LIVILRQRSRTHKRATPNEGSLYLVALDKNDRSRGSQKETGCPISRVLCEKWDSVRQDRRPTHPSRTRRRIPGPNRSPIASSRIQGKGHGFSRATKATNSTEAPQGTKPSPRPNSLDSPKSAEYCSPSPRCRAPNFPKEIVSRTRIRLRQLLIVILRQRSRAQASDSQRRISVPSRHVKRERRR